MNSCTVCARTSCYCTRCYSWSKHLALNSYAHVLLVDGIFLAAIFEKQAASMCTHHHVRLYTFSHSLHYMISPSPSMQLEIKHVTVYNLAHFSLADSTFHAARFEVVGISKYTSIFWTVNHLQLFALYRRTIALNAARDWSILRCMILHIFHWLMAPSMLLVLRSYNFSSEHFHTLDWTPSDTLCTLASISLMNLMELEFGTSCS